MQTIDFWYSIGSTYSYLTVMRLGDVAQREAVTFRWRPYNVRRLMIEQNNIPFANKPTKTAYMWRDIERRSALYGLTPQLPAPYPLPDLPLANQVAILGASQDWGMAYTVAAYKLWFDEGLPAGSEPNLTRALEAAKQDPATTLERAEHPDTIALLERETDIARDLGVFGAPSFVVDGEVFWGDDRLDDAISWARNGSLAAT